MNLRKTMTALAAILTLVGLVVLLALRLQYVPGRVDPKGLPIHAPSAAPLLFLLPFWLLALWAWKKGDSR
jgi:hypothetical protein